MGMTSAMAGSIRSTSRNTERKPPPKRQRAIAYAVGTLTASAATIERRRHEAVGEIAGAARPREKGRVVLQRWLSGDPHRWKREVVLVALERGRHDPEERPEEKDESDDHAEPRQRIPDPPLDP